MPGLLEEKITSPGICNPEPTDYFNPDSLEFWQQAERREDLYHIAVAYYLVNGLNQKEIAGLMGKSESMTSRAVAAAKEKEYLRITYELNIPPKYLAWLPCLINLPTKRKSMLQKYPHLDRCTVVPGKDFYSVFLASYGKIKNNKKEIPTEVFCKVLYKAAAERITNIIEASPQQLFLVSWGPTINNAIQNMAVPPISEIDQLEIFPIIGNFSLSAEHQPDPQHLLEKAVMELAFATSVSYSANFNARLLSQRCRRKLPPRPLLNVAIIKASAAELKNCQPVFTADQTLTELYGQFWDPDDHSGKIWECDTLITSLGARRDRPPEADATIDDYSANFYRAYGYETKFENNFVGDICGILFDSAAQPVDLNNRQLIGPRLEHILHIAQRHRRQLRQAAENNQKVKGAGVVVITTGEEKWRALVPLLQNAFINELVVTEELAERLLAD